MATVTPPTITPLPAPPDPNNRATFNTLAYPWSVAQGVLATQVGAVATNVKANADDAATSTTAANISKLAADADAVATAADRVQTGSDRTQTGLDRTAAAASAASAAAIAGAFVGTSTSSLLIATGSKTFATQTGEQYTAGVFLSAVSAANTANYMFGQVTSYNSATGALALNVQVIGGSGTFADWNISLVGARGAQGPAGTFGGVATSTADMLTGAAIASAATINLDTATGNRVHITGTTTITTVTLTRGPRTVIFDGVLTLTHSATANNLPGLASITTAAGDRAIYESDGTTVYCVSYIKANGTAAVVSVQPGGVYLNKLVTQSSTSFVVPANVFKIRAYAGGKGGNGFGGTAPAGAGSGGGFAFGDIATTPGESLTIDITAGVAKVSRGATDLLIANPGNAGSSTVNVAGGTASINGAITNGAAYAGGIGLFDASGYPGGGSAGSLLGAGFSGGAGGGNGGGGGGIGGVGLLAGGGTGGAATAAGPGGAGGPSVASSPMQQGPGRVIPFADLLLAPCIAAAAATNAAGTVVAGGPGAGGHAGTANGAPGGFGGGGGGGGNDFRGGQGGELGGGGGAGGGVIGAGGGSLACGGAGAGRITGGVGGPATVWIFY